VLVNVNLSIFAVGTTNEYEYWAVRFCSLLNSAEPSASTML
jgi:hypothetical protein